VERTFHAVGQYRMFAPTLDEYSTDRDQIPKADEALKPVVALAKGLRLKRERERERMRINSAQKVKARPPLTPRWSSANTRIEPSLNR
jgi:hypothetical protein